MIKNVIEKPITECFKNWCEHNIPRYWIMFFIPCECGELVKLNRLKYRTYCEDWGMDFDGEEIKENNNENT